MKKVIFELIRIEYNGEKEWISIMDPGKRFHSTISALEWGYKKYGTRKFKIDMDDGTISIKDKNQKIGDI